MENIELIFIYSTIEILLTLSFIHSVLY